MNRRGQYSWTEESVMQFLSTFEPATLADYMAHAGLNDSTAGKRLIRAWDQKLIYIAGWLASKSGQALATYAIGGLPDAPRPKPKSGVERAKASYQNATADEASRRAYYAKKKVYLAGKMADAEYAERHRKYMREWVANKQFEIRGGPAPSKCPLPRPAFYRNIFNELRAAA